MVRLYYFKVYPYILLTLASMTFLIGNWKVKNSKEGNLFIVDVDLKYDFDTKISLFKLGIYEKHIISGLYMSNFIIKKCAVQRYFATPLKFSPFYIKKGGKPSCFSILKLAKITLYKAKIPWSKLSHDTKLQHSLCNIAFVFGGLHLGFERMKMLL